MYGKVDGKEVLLVYLGNDYVRLTGSRAVRLEDWLRNQKCMELLTYEEEEALNELEDEE